jgi:glycosyltransferase involved in cell wall biosynthesis
VLTLFQHPFVFNARFFSLGKFYSMKINVLLPGISRVPTGGAKVMLEYANRLAADGMQVTLIYPVALKRSTINHLSSIKKLRLYRKVFTKRLKGKYSATVWFKLHENCKERLVPYLGEQFVPDADFTFATSWETAEWIAHYPTNKGEKIYVIQDFEVWSGTKEEIERTWLLPIKKIVIARWLQEMLENLGVASTLINNGLDFTTYFIDTPIEHRRPASIIMLYHVLDVKGSPDGLAALEIVKKQVPDLSVTLFSAFPRPDFIPNWMEYFHHPKDLCSLYNGAALFISPSKVEGWGLPRAEAMQCGCATIVTDILGHREYGANGSDLILTPAGDREAMAQQIIALISDNDRRIAIAKAGHQLIRQFTWETAYAKLKQVMGVKEKLKASI